MIKLGRLGSTVSSDPLNKRKKIVIVGGSHSGFSCAWLLLNQCSSLDFAIKKGMLNSSL
jgi:hypothetical protein